MIHYVFFSIQHKQSRELFLEPAACFGAIIGTETALVGALLELWIKGHHTSQIALVDQQSHVSGLSALYSSLFIHVTSQRL